MHSFIKLKEASIICGNPGTGFTGHLQWKMFSEYNSYYTHHPPTQTDMRIDIAYRWHLMKKTSDCIIITMITHCLCGIGNISVEHRIHISSTAYIKSESKSLDLSLKQTMQGRGEKSLLIAQSGGLNGGKSTMSADIGLCD